MKNVQVHIVSTEPLAEEGDVDPESSFQRIKMAMVRAYSLGNAADYDIAIAPRNLDQRVSEFTLDDNDRVYLISRDSATGPAFQRGKQRRD